MKCTHIIFDLLGISYYYSIVTVENVFPYWPRNGRILLKKKIRIFSNTIIVAFRPFKEIENKSLDHNNNNNNTKIWINFLASIFFLSAAFISICYQFWFDAFASKLNSFPLTTKHVYQKKTHKTLTQTFLTRKQRMFW